MKTGFFQFHSLTLLFLLKLYIFTKAPGLEKVRFNNKHIDLARAKSEAAINIYNLNQTINLYSSIQLTLEHIHVTFEGKSVLSDF